MSDNRPITQPFLDWGGIWPGQSGRDEEGRSFFEDPPQGVRLRVQEADKSEPFLRRERPWEEQDLSSMVVLLDGGRYRMWYVGVAPGDPLVRSICYAESEDGFEWHRPELGLCEFQGDRANNILYDASQFGFQSVFVDPSAPAAERYKAIDSNVNYYRDGALVSSAQQNRTEIGEIRKAMELEGYAPDQIDAKAEIRHVVRGAVSPDGLSWTLLEEPLLDVGKTLLDTQNIAAYDEDTGQYLAFLRGNVERRRSLRRTGGSEFGHWDDTRIVLTSDPQDPPHVDFYNSSYCRCPSSGRHLMFVSIFDRPAATLDIHLATSRDGWNWSRPERRPIVDLQTSTGQYSALYASPNLVPLGDQWGIGCLGVDRLHDWAEYGNPEAEPDGEYCWALWKPERLVALEAPLEGQFTTIERICHGDRLLLNFDTEPGGWIKVALVEPPGTPPAPVPELPGFEMDNCDVLDGDHLCQAVSWKGNEDLSALAGRQVSVRIRMAKARLYSLTI